MRIFGFWLIGIGIIYLLIAFNMDVSVSAPSTYVPGYGSIGGGDVANLDLMARRQNHLIVAALITLIGALMAIFGKDGTEERATANSMSQAQTEEDFDGDPDISSDAYRLWLAKHYRIERNDVFDRFVLGEQTFDTLKDALTHAHTTEMQKIADKKAEEERIEAEVAANKEAVRLAKEEADAAFRDSMPKMVVGGIIALALAAAAYFILKETPEERAAREAKEKAEKVELFQSVETKFGVSLPEDASAITITENAADYDFLCNSAKTGTLLKFRTALTEEQIQSLLAKKLGKGESEYGGYLPDEFDWTWQKNKVRYELSMLGDGSPTDVNLCMIK